jgi:hypothetical protein
MTARHFFRPMKDATVTGVLHNLRCAILRDGLDGLEHVDALLRLRGVDPDSLRMYAKRPKHFGRGKLRCAVLEALRDGPMRGRDIARRVQGNGLEYAHACRRRGWCGVRGVCGSWWGES